VVGAGAQPGGEGGATLCAADAREGRSPGGRQRAALVAVVAPERL